MQSADRWISRYVPAALVCALPLASACGGSDASGGTGDSAGGALGLGGNAGSQRASTVVQSGGVTSAGGTLGARTSSLTSGPGSGGGSSLTTSAAGGAQHTGGVAPTTDATTLVAAGGALPTGGVSAVGSTRTSGGRTATSGGATSGVLSSGGTYATGGVSVIGGTRAAGGLASIGGTASTGGMVSTGGAPSTGGTASTSSDPCPNATQVITVDSQGGGQFKTIQSAIDSIPSNNGKLIRVNVKSGTYAEQVTISKPFVCLVGENATATTITHTAGTSITTGGTVMVTGSDFSASNVTFENTAGNGAGQAVALMAKGSRQQFRNCRFLSYQDTLYTNTGTQYFRDCFIQGDVDYIFGDATAVFEDCTVNSVAEGTAVTAPRTPQANPYGLVFLGGKLTASPTTSTVRSNHVYLGRPWGPYGAVAFLNVDLGSHINADGWTTMSNNDLTNVRFFEYKSTGPGAAPSNNTRKSRQLSDAQAANYTVANVLNPWIPSYSR